MFSRDSERSTNTILHQTMSSLPSLSSIDFSKYFSSKRSDPTIYNHLRYSSDLERSSSSSSSSPRSPSSPLLGPELDEKPLKPKKKNSNQRAAIAWKVNRIRTFTIRILCGCVALTVITMVFALSGMTNHTTRRLSKHFDTSAIWQSFPIMQSYYNGLYELVSKADIVPENTGPMNSPKAPKPTAKPAKKEDKKDKKDKKKGGKKKTKGKKKPKAPPKPLPPSITYNPYPDYTSKSYQQEWAGEHVDCSSLIANMTGGATDMKAYSGLPKGMPIEVYGSYDLLGIDNSVCFERRTRLGMYGFKDRDEIPRNVTEESRLFDLEWSGLNWRRAQEQCVKMNENRFSKPTLTEKGTKSALKTRSRTALVIRVWHSYEWQRLDYVNLRSYITELNLKSGGEYDVHLLVHVKDETLPIWSEDSAYRKAVEESIIEEFQGMVTLWNEKMMLALYPSLGVDWRGLPMHGAYRSLWFPLQYFARKHPEYDHFWNLELDIRYTGHWYHFLEKVSDFARKQPRRGLWERNGRFYVPSVHGSWSDFSAMAEQEAHPSERIWGPLSVPGVNLTRHTPTPPFETAEEDTEYTWGVGEEADLITLNPIFDPKNTTWLPRDDFTGYGQERPADSDFNPYWEGPPRRASIVSMYRFSRRLLDVMHDENTYQGHTMCTEQWPATAALHHGLKAVYVPHPVFMDRRWPGKYLTSVLNNGKFGSSGGRQRSIFGDREHHFAGSGFYYGSYWPGALYKRWLGWRWEGKGGEEWEEEHGRMCLPQMLLHPVKDL